VISTPYWYAEELLADGRGILVPPKSPDSIAQALERLLSSDSEREEISEKARRFGEQMLWENVALAYGEVFEASVHEDSTPVKVAPMAEFKIPDLDLRHFYLMTDDVGMLQHATFNIPNRSEGYCSDDNARALQFATLAYDVGLLDLSSSLKLSAKFLGFIAHAFDPHSGEFRNFMSYSRNWMEHRGSDDSQGRCLHALAITAARGCDPGVRSLARRLFDEGIPRAQDLKSPRAIAFTVKGLAEAFRPGDENAKALENLAGRLLKSLDEYRGPDWIWFENSVTYCNAVLPHALIAAGERLKRSDFSQGGLESLEWLARQQTDKQGRFLPIGSDGFMDRNGNRALYDQQPVEAWTSLSAYAKAYETTGEKLWLNRARAAFGWFLGENHLDVPLYDPETGGCRDGLHADRVNQNMGAESTLSMLLSLCEWKLITKKTRPIATSIVHTM
jgi:hypothetical protein